MTTDKTRLSHAAADAIRAESRASGGVAIASSTLWEIAIMSAKGRFVLAKPLSEYLRYAESVFIVLPITGAIAERSTLFTTNISKDPTDHLVAATAVIHGVPFITKDRLIRASREVDCIW